MVFLDDRTLLVGMGYRTNQEAVDQLRPRLAEQGVEIRTFDLPHFHGADECLHLMSFISMLDADLAVGYPPMMPVRLVQLLEERGVALVEVPDEEFPTMGPNVLALGPRRALALDGNPHDASTDGSRRRRGAHLRRPAHQPQRRRRSDLLDAPSGAGLTARCGPERVRDLRPWNRRRLVASVLGDGTTVARHPTPLGTGQSGRGRREAAPALTLYPACHG